MILVSFSPVFKFIVQKQEASCQDAAAQGGATKVGIIVVAH
ncbi:hypothetical protein ACGVWS_05485 [Enterobacteriaceae bacterium LUAb1]